MVQQTVSATNFPSEDITENTPIAPDRENKMAPTKKFYQQWWFWVILLIVALGGTAFFVLR